MKFPSVKYLFSQAGETFSRFYLPLIFSFIGTVVAIVQIKDITVAHSRILFTCSLGLSLSLGCKLFEERSGKPLLKLLLPLLSVGLLLIYWQYLTPDNYFEDTRKTLTYFVLAVVMHLFVAIAPYIAHNEKTGFWRFNEVLYARMLLSLLFSGAIFIGLALAILACETLFKIDLDNYIYIRLWFVVLGVFNTWFFLAGVPNDYTEINTETAFPKPLKIFTQYILIPIVVLYMAILYAYGIKIIGLWSLPKGWVSMLIFCYAAVGILAVLLVNPLRDSKDNAWVRLFSKFFFIATLPVIVLLYAAIWVRVSNYGITESRYYLLLLGTWLGFIALYFVLSKKKNIKIIPTSLAIIGILSLAGPWSAFSVSERSQLNRLESILIKNKIWKPGEKVSSSSVKLNDRAFEQVRSIVAYFVTGKNITALKPIYAMNLDSMAEQAYLKNEKRYSYDWQKRDDMQHLLVSILCTNDDYIRNPYSTTKYYTADLHEGVDVAGYSRVFNFKYNPYYKETHWIFLTHTDSLEVTVTSDDSTTNIVLMRDGKIAESIPMSDFIRHLKKDSVQISATAKEMTIDGTGAIKPRIIIQTISLHSLDEDTINEGKLIDNMEGYILIK